MSPRTLPLPPEHRFRFPRPRRLLRRVFRKSVLQVLFLFFCAYFLIYVFLSAGGRLRPIQDQIKWVPFGLRFDLHRNEEKQLVVRGSFFGYMYAPLILFDRAYVHGSIPLDSPEGRAWEKLEQEINAHEQGLQSHR